MSIIARLLYTSTLTRDCGFRILESIEWPDDCRTILLTIYLIVMVACYFQRQRNTHLGLYFSGGRAVGYCGVPYVCLSERISQKPQIRTFEFSMFIACGRGSILFWQRWCVAIGYLLPVLWMTSCFT